MTSTVLPRSFKLAGAFALLGLLGIASVLAGCLLGPADVPADKALRVLAGLIGGGDAGVEQSVTAVVRDIRLPRACLSWLVGAALGMGGAVYQGLLRNELADPFTLGVSTGAAFGATLAITLGLPALGVFARIGLDAVPLCALAGAMAALAAVVVLARTAGGLSRETLVLAGIVTATFLSALISLLKSLNEESVAGIVYWLMGGFAGRGFGHVGVFLPYFAAGLALIATGCRELDILAMGDTQARALGVRVKAVRLRLLTGAGFLCAASVAVSGVIGFIGLIVPHLCRRFTGARHATLLAACALGGGTLLSLSDLVARTVLPHGAELPAGVVTALFGGPFFCLVLRTGRGARP